MTIPLMTNIERLIKNKLNPLIVPGFDGYDIKTYPKGAVGTVYWYLCLVVNTIVMNYVVQVRERKREQTVNINNITIILAYNNY
jgi:hypothetical protein